MYAIYIYGNMDPINIPPMLAYIPYMDPMGYIGTIQKNWKTLDYSEPFQDAIDGQRPHH